MRDGEDRKLIESELALLRALVDPEHLYACREDLVQLRICRSRCSSLVLQAQFPAQYPRRLLLNELKSKTLPEVLLRKLLKLADDVARSHLGKGQLVAVYQALRKVVDNNLLLSCWDEVQQLRDLTTREFGEQALRVSEGQGTLTVRVEREGFYLTAVLRVPGDYPDCAPTLQIKETNFPRQFRVVFEATTKEVGRRLLEPHVGLKGRELEQWRPSPPLEKMLRWLLVDCFLRYAHCECPACKKRVLLPETAGQPPQAPVVRLYCRDVYHHQCLDDFLSSPPFPPDGKRCQACQLPVKHEKFVKTVDPKLAEKRWAYEEARKREVGDAIDFLGGEFEAPK